jgi:hypothetical protein
MGENSDPLVRGMDPRIRIRTKMSWIRNTAFNHKMQEPSGDTRKNHPEAASNQRDQSQTASNQQNQTFAASSQLRQTLAATSSQRTEAFNEECQKFLLSNCRRQEETVSTSQIQSCLAAESWIQAGDSNREPEAPSFSGDALARRRSFLSRERAEEEGSRESCEKRTSPADLRFQLKPDQSDSKLETSGVREENLLEKHKGRLVPGTENNCKKG